MITIIITAVTAIASFFSTWKNGVTNAGGTIIGVEDVIEGIELIGQGDKQHGYAKIAKGVVEFVAFYCVGK